MSIFNFGPTVEPEVEEVVEIVKPMVGILDINMYLNSREAGVCVEADEMDPLMLVDCETGNSTELSSEEYEALADKTRVWLGEMRAALIARSMK